MSTKIYVLSKCRMALKGDLPGKYANAARDSIAAYQASNSEAISGIHSLQGNRSYVPFPGEAQDLFTFLVSMLTWFAEWIASDPLWAMRVWRCIFRNLTSSTSSERDNCERSVFSMIPKRCLLIIPAIAGVVPIIVGRALGLRLEGTEGGALAMGCARTTHDGLTDPNAVDDLFRKGFTMRITFVSPDGALSCSHLGLSALL